MWSFLLVCLSAAALTIVQVAFLSHLPAPFSDISFPLIAISLGVVRDRPLQAAYWALTAGVLMDLHGLFGFGTETALLFITLSACRLIFRRVLTNASSLAVFLLTASAVLVRWIGLMAVDGIRVLFGGIPYLISFNPEVALTPLRAAVVNGLIVLAIIAAEKALRHRFQQTFLSHAAAKNAFS